MLILITSQPSFTIVCDIPNLVAGVPNWGDPVGYVVEQEGSGFAPGGGTVVASAASGVGPGWIAIQPTPTETDQTGDVTFAAVDGSGNIIGRRYCQTTGFDPDNATNLGLANLNATVGSRGTSNYAGGAVASVTGNVGGSVNGLTPTAVANLLDLAAGVEANMTVRQSLRLILAALAAKLAISGSIVTIRDTNDTKDRITATTDGTGQRTAITYDVS